MEQNIKPFLTVIVPAYNVEKYLEQCLESLLNQTIINHKVIIVDDGSTDKTGEIADRYVNMKPNLFYCIHQTNHGLGAARNKGLKIVDTPFVTFLDSDDWLDCMYIEKVLRGISMHEDVPDIIFTLPWNYNAVTRNVEEWHDKLTMEQIFYPHGGAIDTPSITTNVFINPRLYEIEASTNRRIYYTQFAKDIKLNFKEGVKWEDVGTHFYSLHYARCCIAIRTTGFFYRINTGSQITNSSGASRLDIIPVFKDILHRAYEESWADWEISYIIRMMWSFVTWSINMTNIEYIQPLLKELHSFFKSIPNKYFKLFYEKHSYQRKRDALLVGIIKSPFYRMIADDRIRKLGMQLADKVRHILRRR